MKLPNVSGEFMVLQAINLALPEDERTKPHNTVNLCCFPCTKMKSKSSVPFDINSFLRPIIEDFKAASSDGFDVTYKDSENNTVTERVFCHLVAVVGDASIINRCLCFNKPSGKFPCHFCLTNQFEINGYNAFTSFTNRPENYNPAIRDNLYLHKAKMHAYLHLEDFVEKREELNTDSEKRKISKRVLNKHGIKNWSAFFDLKSIILEHSFPLDTMDVLYRHVFSTIEKSLLQTTEKNNTFALKANDLKMFKELFEGFSSLPSKWIGPSYSPRVMLETQGNLPYSELRPRRAIDLYLPIIFYSSLEKPVIEVFTELLMFIKVTSSQSFSYSMVEGLQLSAKKLVRKLEQVFIEGAIKGYESADEICNSSERSSSNTKTSSLEIPAQTVLYTPSLDIQLDSWVKTNFPDIQLDYIKDALTNLNQAYFLNTAPYSRDKTESYSLIGEPSKVYKNLTLELHQMLHIAQSIKSLGAPNQYWDYPLRKTLINLRQKFSKGYYPTISISNIFFEEKITKQLERNSNLICDFGDHNVEKNSYTLESLYIGDTNKGTEMESVLTAFLQKFDKKLNSKNVFYEYYKNFEFKNLELSAVYDPYPETDVTEDLSNSRTNFVRLKHDYENGQFAYAQFLGLISFKPSNSKHMIPEHFAEFSTEKTYTFIQRIKNDCIYSEDIQPKFLHLRLDNPNDKYTLGQYVFENTISLKPIEIVELSTIRNPIYMLKYSQMNDMLGKLSTAYRLIDTSLCFYIVEQKFGREFYTPIEQSVDEEEYNRT